MNIKAKIKGKGIQALLLFSLFIIGVHDATAQDSKELGKILSSKFDIWMQRYPYTPDAVPVHFSWFLASDEELNEVECRSFVPDDWEALKETPGLESFIKWYESKHTSTDVVSSGTTQVSGNWVKFAFTIIRNSDWEEGKKYTLMVDHISFVARTVGEDWVFNHAKILKANDYCGLPFLYVLPPEKTYLRYEPRLNNPLENLALYIDRLYIEELPAVDTEESDSSDDTSLMKIPVYEIEATITGRFISEQGQTVAPFVKHVSFDTSEKQ